ncbi:stage II sporulation protein D [Candidatus Gastranaerophilus sp. (ex Termes propinquus)]|nr:stage II sporulation protein D [Candidatus Gastranaerophilus sp. (ex Termes propinquus)]
MNCANFLKGIILSLVLLIFCQVTMALEERKIVRVGISDQSFSVYEHQSVDFVSSAELLLTDPENDFKFPKGTVLKVLSEDGRFSVSADNGFLKISKGPLVLTSNGTIGILNLNRKGAPALYEGQFELKMAKNSRFNIVNVLDMQTYLKGVVPNEMPVSFGLEALKAQAVAARNYANRKSIYTNYDICDSTACQVYYGANSHNKLSDLAVDETNGIFALYKLEPILAMYSSTAGGITESYANTFGQNANFTPPTVLPYMVSVSDNKDYTVLSSEEAVREFYSRAVPTNDIKSPLYRWRVQWERKELEDVLNKTLVEQSKQGLVEPAFDKNCFLEGIESVKVLQRGDSGKALLVEIHSRTGKWRVRKELGIRRVFQKDGKALSSANFFIDTEAQSTESGIFDSVGDSSAAQAGVSKIIFTGGGFGHGVGMSQFGAGFMAGAGKKYNEILQHYYTGTTVGTIPLTVTSHPSSYKISFFAEKGQKYFLKFDNSKKLSKFEFLVNATPFSPSMNVFEGKILYFDVTKYLKQGAVNEIEMSPLSDRDRHKSTRVWIEMATK